MEFTKNKNTLIHVPVTAINILEPPDRGGGGGGGGGPWWGFGGGGGGGGGGGVTLGISGWECAAGTLGPWDPGTLGPWNP